MIVFATHGDAFVHDAIASARAFMPNEAVCIVKTGPEDEFPLAADHVLGDNVAYETGAWWRAFETFPNEPYFYFLHDSTLIKGELPKPELGALATLPNWTGVSGSLRGRIQQITDEHAIPTEAPFKMLLGSMFFCERQIMKKISEHSFAAFRPANKEDSTATERIWGLLFKHLGLEMTEVMSYHEAYAGSGIVHKLRGRRP